MTQWLIRRFIAPDADVRDQAVRGKYGTLGSATGIAVNAILAAMKFMIGVMTGSVAVTADAANNLSDAGGSVVSLITMRMAQKPIDREHPFGHGRMEYIGALAVGVLILVMGVELLKSGVSSIIKPETLTFGWVPFAILCVSILLKAWLYRFYMVVGKRIESATLLAAAKDSLSDVMATSAVAVSMLVGYLTNLPVDGWIGTVVALLVLKAGLGVCREMLDSLMGGRTDPELGRQIIDMLLTYDQVLGTHDLVVHDYGPGRCVASIHAEVPASGNIVQLHEMIDLAEREISEKLNVPICIHMDPVVTGDLETDMVIAALNKALKEIDERLMLHDLRRVPGEERINLIFDVVIPAEWGETRALSKRIAEAAKAIDPRHFCVIRYDIDYYHN